MTAYEWQDLIWRGDNGRNWSPEARLLAAYLLSGPNTNRIACMSFTIETAARHTGLKPDRIDDVIGEFARDGFIRVDLLRGWLWIPDVLRVHVFGDTDEVRRALPELASVPRDVSFREELVQVFRSSADRPGAPVRRATGWLSGILAGILGDTHAAELSRGLTTVNTKLHRELPGLPRFGPAKPRSSASLTISGLNYARRCRDFIADLLNHRELRLLGMTAIVCAVLFVVFPGIDLGVAAWFFKPPRDFFIGASWIGRFFDTDIHFGMEWFLAVLGGVSAYGLVRRRAVWGLTPKRLLFIALSIALAAGLMTNVIFKDSWGRARPSQIVEFGGTKLFSPPFMRSDQCRKNCSFVSGDASLAASFMAFAVIAERHRRRWWLSLGSFTALVGFMRMARGSHFLSDVVFAVLFTLMIVAVLARLILQDRWRAWPRWRLDFS